MRKSLTLYEILALYIGLPEGNKSYTNAFWLNNLAWPPNLFAVCACILNETGDYVKLVSPNTTITNLYENGLNGQKLETLSNEWKKSISKREKLIGLI